MGGGGPFNFQGRRSIFKINNVGRSLNNLRQELFCINLSLTFSSLNLPNVFITHTKRRIAVAILDL